MPTARSSIRGSYLGCYRYRDSSSAKGFQMAFESEHRPIGWYFGALDRPASSSSPPRDRCPSRHRPRLGRWQRLPLFLHVRALRP